MSQHECILSDCLKCLDTFLVVPASYHCVQELAVTYQSYTLGRVLTRLMKAAQILKVTYHYN